jgi:hypothetical protein
MHYAMKACRRADVETRIFLTWAIAGGEWSTSRSSHLTPRERAPSTHWMSPRTGMGCEMRKILPLPELYYWRSRQTNSRSILHKVLCKCKDILEGRMRPPSRQLDNQGLKPETPQRFSHQWLHRLLSKTKGCNPAVRRRAGHKPSAWLNRTEPMTCCYLAVAHIDTRSCYVPHYLTIPVI